MILFGYSPNGIAVIRTNDCRTENIGRLQYVAGEWLWDRQCNWTVYRTMYLTEKRAIIGMIDALSNNPIRPIAEMKRRWEEIIGPCAVALEKSYRANAFVD